MAQHGINLVVVVFNDGAYGNVHRMQGENFEGHHIASDLHNPDFVKLAESFGVQGRKAEGTDALEKELSEALAADAPALIEVPMTVVPNPFAVFAPPPDLMQRAQESLR